MAINLQNVQLAINPTTYDGAITIHGLTGHIPALPAFLTVASLSFHRITTAGKNPGTWNHVGDPDTIVDKKCAFTLLPDEPDIYLTEIATGAKLYRFVKE